ncbi:hypothetical protein AB9P05_18435 [Roseivirga sp. BDSF3-8]|uniref:hypothetical protein n=1 Tax=Roseivirga sp. BDSF3-8 TaxID=3241598 RepID=UPI00353187B8
MKRNQIAACIGAFGFMLTGSVAIGQTMPQTPDQPDYAAYEDWDTDANESIDNDEFYNGITNSNRMSEWDSDADGSLTDAELYEGSRNAWDTNQDGMLDENEWNTGMETYFAGYSEDAYGAFNDWDTNQDGILDTGEYNQGIGNTGYYDAWDADSDNMISDREFSQGLYRSYDADGSGYLESREYDKYRGTKRARPQGSEEDPGPPNDDY